MASVSVRDIEVPEEVLIADLREAFEGNADPFRPVGAGSASSAPDREAPRAPQGLTPGTRLGDFEIRAELGRGGMGVVYHARQVSLGREVALKVLPGYARHDPRAVQRFQNEAQAAARLHHTHIVAIYAQGQHEGHFFYAMELIDGVSLDAVIRSHPELLSSAGLRGSSSGLRLSARTRVRPSAAAWTAPEPSEPAAEVATPLLTRDDYRHLATLLAGVADALASAHQSGIIHRDVKPHNVLLSAAGNLHLTDFGLARLTDQPHLTLSGEVMGTPAYLSPEQISADADAIDHRTDVYSLGVTMYELLTRRKPFEAETREQMMNRITRGNPTPPRKLVPRIPRDLETICLRAMEREPARRYASAAALADDLDRFATGRPIRARRATPLEKAAKWVRRHKTLSTAVSACAAVVLLSVSIWWMVVSGRHAEAHRLLDAAYDQYVYNSYLTSGLEESHIEPAVRLGADPAQLALLRGLAAVSRESLHEAASEFEQVVAAAPDDPRADYLLAWIQHESGRHAEAHATIAQAESGGPPTTADTAFFRALALHRDDPEAAIEAYRTAIALRAQASEFFPQAMLHLARARNQRLYARRDLDGFAESQATLRQLIDHAHYGAYPYYLLSIAHRLAAEIYRGSQGTRGDDALVEEHYQQALHWARRGQEVDPQDDRPVVAEAECLESMGDFAAARAARTRAIDLAQGEQNPFESYHYRWRLNYWLGDYESALADLQTCTTFDPDSPFYAHVYPALVLHEMDRDDEARDHARALLNADSPTARQVIWSATSLRLINAGAEAGALLDAYADELTFSDDLWPPQSPEWMNALFALVRGEADLDDLKALAADVAMPWRLWGEAYFHAAARDLAYADVDAALEGFTKAYRAFDGEQRYTFHAKTVLINLQKKLAGADRGAVSWRGVSVGLSFVYAQPAIPMSARR